MAYGRVDGTSALKPEDSDNPDGNPNFYYNKSIKPNLTVLEGGKSKKATKADDASKSLGDAEKNAIANPITKTGAGAASALSAEAGGNFINNVRGAKVGGKKSGLKGKLKKGGPIGAIIALFMGVGGLMLGSQSLMPFSLVAQFIENFDSIGVSTSLRSKYFLKFQSGEVRDCRKSTIFGKKFKVSNKQKNKLKSEGIETIEVTDAKGKTRTVFLFDDGSSTKTIISPSDKVDLDHLVGTKIGSDDIAVGKIMSFDSAYTDVPDFRNGYNKASRTWKGSVGAWFDSITVRFLQSNKLTRNRFKDFQKRVQEEYDGNARNATIDAMSKNVDELEMGQKTTELAKQENEDGSSTTTSTSEDSTTKIRPGGHTDAEVKAKLKELETKYKKSASSIAEMSANVICGVAQFLGAVGLVVAAAEALQLYQIISSFTEAIDKVKGGEGSNSPIHVLSTALTEPHNTVTFHIDDQDNFVAQAKDDEASIDAATIKEETSDEQKSAMQSEAIAAMYGNYKINQDDKSVSSFTIGGNLINKVFMAIGASAASFVSCALAKAATALVGAVMDAVVIAGCIASLGIGCIVDAAVEGLSGIAGSLAFAAGFAAATAILYPMAVKWLTRDLISELGGEDLGNALVSGANMYLGKNHLTGGGSPTNKDGLLAYEIEHQKVIADNAEYERANRSPFDITSKYTFLGSLLTKFASFQTSSYSTSGFLTTIGNIAKNSLVSILPSASAVTATNMIEGTGNCPYLESIDAVGDAFCNPYIVDDVRSETMSMHPGEVIDVVANYNGFENDTEDDMTINKSSNLARYIVYCSERSSQFGAADQNIANDFSPIDKGIDEIVGDSKAGNAVGTVANSALGVVPIVGDLIDVGQNSNQLAHAGWITGATCVSGNNFNSTIEDSLSATPEWSEVQYYQRYVEDQRLMESIDPTYTSAVTAFLDEYYTEHPLDDSYEGILARYSGLDKEHVVAVLDTINYMNYIAEYNPSTRYDFTSKNEHQQKTYIDSSNNVATDSENVILQYATIYNDVRNRTATV